MDIDADLDGGAIKVLGAARRDAVELALRPDTKAEFMQWFHFRLRGAAPEEHTFRITNAADATYSMDAWDGYRVCASHDLEDWFRIPTDYENGVLTFRHTPEQPTVYYGYFAAYPWDRHQRLLARADAGNPTRIEVVGRSVEGRPMSLVVVGDEDDATKRKVWVSARQHPGETAAEYFMEGVLERLLDADDDLRGALLDKAVFYLVPNMNPDGGVLGNLRTNAAGRNLNREWKEPSEDESPEVFHVLRKMEEIGVDLFLDIHADERNPYCFAAGCEGNPGYTDRIEELEDLFTGSLLELDGDFQAEYGYERDAPGEADLSTAGNFVGEAFDCLSLTIEMPFKDNANHPDPRAGWSPDRARHLGRTTLESVFVCLDSVR
jgi:murein tripeptide amidase MpaA